MRRLILPLLILSITAVVATGFARRSLSRVQAPATITAAKTTAETAAYARAADYSAAHAGMSVLVLKDGVPVYERYEGDYSAARSHQLASGTKSFWGVLAACAVQDGVLTSLDEVVADTITEWKTDPKRSRITVRHLLSFTSGLKPAERLFSRPDVKDRYVFAVNQPAVAEPGATYHYDDVHLYAFGGLLTRKLAARAKREGKPTEDVLAYLDRRVFKPVGLDYGKWARDRAGNPTLPYGATLPAREWAKFGELIRQNGKWKGTQIVPASLLQECLQSGSKANPAYGLTWWLNTPAPKGVDSAAAADGAGGASRRRRSQGDMSKITEQGIYAKGGATLAMAAGAGQQRLYILPEKGLVIVRQANPNMARAMMGLGRMDNTFRDDTFLALLLGDAATASAAK